MKEVYSIQEIILSLSTVFSLGLASDLPYVSFGMDLQKFRNLGQRIRSAKFPKFADLKSSIQTQMKSGKFAGGIRKAVQNFDPQATAEWISRAVQKKGAAFYGTLSTILLSTYFVADLTALVVDQFIPEPPPARPVRSELPRSKSLEDYSIIFTRNLFNSRGLIPGEEGPAGPTDSGGPPIKTTLPLNLVGTLIMADERRSVATIEDKSSSIVYPVQIDDEIPGKIKVLSIEPRKVIFLNKNTNRREYSELPVDTNAINPKITVGTATTGIERVSPTQFNVSRTEVDKALSDISNILTQARAVPNFENGVPAGYKLFQIVPGSIFDKLGLQNGDVISGLNGEPLNDPSKAFEKLSELKTANHLELQVKKDGRAQTYSYDFGK